MSEREDLLVGEFPFVPKQVRALQKRNALIESGRTLFIEKGYEQTTAKEIASHAGVATGTFYRYFSDKRQLLMSLLENRIDSLMPPEPTWLADDPESQISTLLAAYDERLKRMGLQRVLPELLHKDSELAEVIESARKKIHLRIVDGLKQAWKAGLTWKDLNFDMAAWAIMMIVENVPKREELSSEVTDYSAISKIICRIVFPPK
jgi:TetR/AcrR family transcriptional repressor of mexJK operon